MSTITSITITKNNGATIGKCLDSLAFCDARVVVDSGSTDNTVEIAREKGAHVAFHEWLGFGPQKNFAKTLASSEWIFWLDADEEVTPELAAVVQETVRTGDADGYCISRLSWFCGQPMRHSGWHPDWVLRLFRRNRGQWTGGMSHDHVVCEGKVKRISGMILHYPVMDLRDALAKVDYYSTVGAKELAASNRRITFMSGIAHGFFAFFRTYILQLGFLDGQRGFLLAVTNAEGAFYRYMKAWVARKHAAARRMG